MLLKTKDTIFIKNEVRKSLVTNKNPSTKDIITHYMDKLKSEIKRIINHKELVNNNLQCEINDLKNENTSLTQTIVKLKEKIQELEIQFGKKISS